jgi:hypothetical protein
MSRFNNAFSRRYQICCNNETLWENLINWSHHISIRDRAVRGLNSGDSWVIECQVEFFALINSRKSSGLKWQNTDLSFEKWSGVEITLLKLYNKTNINERIKLLVFRRDYH